LATPLGKTRRQLKFQSTSDIGNSDDAANNGGDKTSIHPSNISSLSPWMSFPDELRKALQAKIDANVKAFLESCTKDRRDKITQFHQPVYSDSNASTSTGAEVNYNNKPKFDEEV
jgi:hypothetical protein